MGKWKIEIVSKHLFGRRKDKKKNLRFTASRAEHGRY